MATINPNKLNAFRSYQPQSESAKALTAAEKAKPVDNDVSLIRFFEEAGPGGAKPYLKATPSPVEDTGRLAKIFEATPAELDSIKADPAKFETFVKTTLEDRNDYFNPTFGELEGAPTRYKFNNIIGQRVDQFAEEALSLARDLYPAGAQRDAAMRTANLATRDLYSRTVTFDSFETNGYASFGHDAAFVHVYEKQLEDLNKIDVELLPASEQASVARAKKQIQGELDDIFRHKYVEHNSNMQETDAEETMGLIAIDQGSRQRISETKDSAHGIVPKFEIMNLEVDGESKAVFYDASQDKYFFDGGSEQVPADKIGDIQRTPVSAQDVTFRRKESGESFRSDFRFDWNGDGYVQQGKIDWVSWAGHCNDKAALEAAGVVVPDGHEGVKEYNSASGNTVHYDRDLLNEALLSFSEFGSYMSKKTGGQAVADIGATEFASARDDDRPDIVDLGNGRKIPYSSRPNEFKITTIKKGDETYEASKAFREYLVADDSMSAEKNPLYKSTTDGDYVNLDLGNAVIEASVKVQVFDENSGYPKMESKDITIDFANPPEEPILIDSLMADAGKRELYEIRLDVENKKWMYQKIRMEKGDDGKFKRVELAGEKGENSFDPADITGLRETSLDNPSTYLPFVDGAMKTGRNATAETADGSGVWNGRIKTLSKRLEKREGDWERVEVKVSARYGANTGSYLAHLDKTGEPDFYVPLAMPADFWWRSQVTFAPEAEGLVNSKALERGAVTVEGGTVHADAISDLMEVLHCAFNDRKYTILHQGQRYAFDSKEEWEAEVAKLQALRAAVYSGGGDEPAPVVEPIQINKAGTLALDEIHSFDPIQVKEDGVLRFDMDGTGDADIYVKVNGEVSKSNWDHRPYTSGSDENFELPVKAGDIVNVMVHGYKGGSDYDVKIDSKPVE